MVIVDPVQFDRNAAAALSLEKFEKFVFAAKAFLKNPSPDFFVEKEFDVRKIEKGKNVLIVVNIKALDGKTDVVGAKILKVYENIKNQLKEFVVLGSDWKWDKKKKSQAYFILEKKTLPKTFVRTGPPISQKNACKNFKEKNGDVFVKDKRLYANIKREFRKPKDLTKSLIKKDYIKNKVKTINVK
jgi:tRNA nucleotidyltransferase (CCA-adding enzyme)